MWAATTAGGETLTDPRAQRKIFNDLFENRKDSGEQLTGRQLFFWQK